MDAKELEALLTPLVEREGGELVDLQWRKEGPQWVLRLFLDKPNGITLDDCAYFSDRVSATLDDGDKISRSYVLEVSSPGLDRVIKKDKDFGRFAGKTVKLRLKLPENGHRKFTGVLKGLNDGKVEVLVDKDLRAFARGGIEEIRLDDSAAIDFSGD